MTQTLLGKVALVTGGNRGLGKAFVQALLDAGVPMRIWLKQGVAPTWKR